MSATPENPNEKDTSSRRASGESPEPSALVESVVWALRALLKQWPIVVAFILLGCGAAFGYSKTRPRIYEATSLLEFDPDVVKPLGSKTDPMVGFTSIWDTREYYETQYRIIQSDRVLSGVARDLGLQNDPEFLGPAVKRPASLEVVVEMLRGRLVVEPIKGSRLFYIRVHDEKPALARRLSEAVSRTYIAQNLEKMVTATGDTVVWISGQLDHLKGELEQSENSLHEFKRENDLPSSTLDDLSKMVRLEMQEYDSALTKTRLRRQELSARHQELSKVDIDAPDQIPASELLANAFLSALRKQYQDASRERVELIAEGKGDNHPLVRRADERIALAKTQLASEIRTIQGAVARDLAIIQQQEAGEAGLYESSRKRAVELNLKELEFHRLDRLRAQNEKLYAVLLEQLKQADLRRMMNTNNIRLVDPPNEPRSPISPKVPTNIGIGLLIGVLLGIVLALGRESLDNTLKTPEDVEKKLNITFLGILPELGGKDLKNPPNDRSKRRRVRPAARFAPELIVHDDPGSGIAEAARSLRTNLLFMNPDHPYRKILVTSAAPSEGKTTVAVSTAVSLAQSGKKVCIIDCDLRRPRLHRIFDRAGDVGIMNVILGEVKTEEAAKPTMVPNLSCMPCGPLPPSSADVVSSEKFRHVLDELAEKFDCLVLDSPPTVAVTDSAILSTLVDGVVMVIRAFRTPIGLSKTGLRQLRDVDAPIAGAVLNAVNLDRHQYYYEGYYYYRREGYAPHPTPPGEPVAATPAASGEDAPPPN